MSTTRPDGDQTAGTIGAVNRDPEVPIAEPADLFVVGDMFSVATALVAALKADAEGLVRGGLVVA